MARRDGDGDGDAANDAGSLARHDAMRARRGAERQHSRTGKRCGYDVNGHTTLNAPGPVRSPQLSSVGSR